MNELYLYNQRVYILTLHYDDDDNERITRRKYKVH